MTTDRIAGRIPSFLILTNLIRCTVEVVHVFTGRNETDSTHYWQNLGWFENLKSPKLSRNSVGFSEPDTLSWVLRVDEISCLLEVSLFPPNLQGH